MIGLLALVAETAANLSPLGLDWWIVLGGWVPGFTSAIIAILIWARARKGGKE